MLKDRLKFPLTIFLLFCITLVFAQQEKIDSLEGLLPTASEDSHPQILIELAELTKREPNRSIGYAERALAIATQNRDNISIIKAYRAIGIANGYNNKYDIANEYLLKSLTLAEQEKQWSLAGDAAINVGTIYYVIRSDYQQAIEYYLSGLRMFEKAKDQKGIASALSGIGITYTLEKKFDLALDNLLRSLNIYKEIGADREVPKLYVNIGTVYQELKDFSKAIDYMGMAIDGFDQTQNDRGKAHALFSLGEIYRDQKNYDRSVSTLKKALALNEQSNHKNSIADCLIALGKTYLAMNNLESAEASFLQVIEIAGAIKKRESISDAYKHLATVYRSRNEYQKAFDALNQHKILNDSIYDAARNKTILELQSRFDTEKKEKEIMMLRQEKAMNQIYLFVAIGLIVSISTIAWLAINRQKMKIRSEREIAEKESQLMEERKTLYEAELRNRELSEQQLHGQLDYKNKELASYTLHVIQKNETLENLKEAIEEMRMSPDGEIRQKLNSLLSMVNYSFNLDRDWETFKIHFEQVHTDFFKKLLEMYPDLSANDLKLCSLIKLNLDNRGIAAILNISQESAKVARHRLRKKLELSADQTLISFLSAVEA